MDLWKITICPLFPGEFLVCVIEDKDMIVATRGKNDEVIKSTCFYIYYRNDSWKPLIVTFIFHFSSAL